MKYNVLLLTLIALMMSILCSTFATTRHTLAALVTRVPGHATAAQGGTLTRRVPQLEQPVEPRAVNETCEGEGRPAESGATPQGMPPQSAWHAAFKDWRQQVQSIALCPES